MRGISGWVGFLILLNPHSFINFRHIITYNTYFDGMSHENERQSCAEPVDLEFPAFLIFGF